MKNRKLTLRLRQMSSKQGKIKAINSLEQFQCTTVYMYGKRIKKKNKKYSRNNVILSLWTISVGIQQKYMPKCLKIKCHVTDYFVTLVKSQIAYARAIQNNGKNQTF